MNTFKTFFLMLVMTGILLIAGMFWGGVTGIIVMLVIALVINFFSYWFSDKMALRMAHAHEVTPETDPDLHAIVDQQAYLANIPKPKVYVIESDSPNAFATGRNPKNAAIAVTTGIRRILTREELAGVIAHELAHVGNRDTLIMSMVATIAMAISLIAMVAQFAMIFGGFGRGGDRGGHPMVGIIGLLVVAIVLPLAATVVRLAISRAREYQADSTGAKTSGQPYALASALEKLEMGAQVRPMKVSEGAAHLFIVNPLGDTRRHDHGHGQVQAFGGGGFSRLFSTHPPIQERVKRLREMRTGW